jgi:uncharacterized protein (TIGR02246 family)
MSLGRMRIRFATLVFPLFVTKRLLAEPAAVDERAADTEQIQQIVSDANRGWDEFDVERAAAEYADGASWFNAFGRERHGKDAIRELIARVLASPGFRAGKKGPLHFEGIEFLDPALAIVHTTQETLGQKQLGGAELGPRRTHIYSLMCKAGARWQTRLWIASDQQSGGTLPPEPGKTK